MDDTFSEPKSVEDFAAFLIKSRLVHDERVQEMVERFREADRLETAASFGDFLVNHGGITGWQCAKLLAGRWKEFYLDDYVFMDKLGYDQDFAYYRARDMRDGSIVKLIVTPMAKVKGPKVEYRVERDL